MKFTVVLKLNAEAAEEAIKRVLLDYPGFGLEENDTIKRVTFVVEDRLERYGMTEHSVAYFDRVEVEIQRDCGIEG